MISRIRQRATYVIGDYVMVNIAWFAFNVIRYNDVASHTDFPTFGAFLCNSSVMIGQLMFPLMMLLIYYLSGYYVTLFFKSRLDELLNTISTTIIGSLLIYFAVIVDDEIPDRASNYQLLLTLMGLLFGFVYAFRLTVTTIATHNIQRRRWSFNTLIVGTSQKAMKIEERLRSMPRAMGFNVVGYVSTGSPAEARPSLNLPVYSINSLEEVCKAHDVKNLIVVTHRHGMNATLDLINRLFPLGLSIYITPTLFHLITSRQRLGNVAGEPLINISNANISPWALNMKRLGDIVLSAMALIVLLPLLGVLALVVKCTSPGPVLYRQERIGYRKRPFYILKFRSMTTDAESSGPALASTDDPRVTPFGRFMRKYRLDELPQFWNVLRGEMSIVGPRPEREYYIRQIVARAPYYMLIHQVRPGITSWGMVKYGYASDVDGMIERLSYDLLYLENISLAIDMKILLYTLKTVITGKGV